jgi:hypothetical protein
MVMMERVLVNVVDITHGNSNAHTLDRTSWTIFFMELEKGDGVFLHCCTLQHVLLHTPVSWIVMLLMQYWEKSKYPNMLWRCVICPFNWFECKRMYWLFHFVYGMSTVLFIHLLAYCFLCNIWHDTKPNKNAKYETEFRVRTDWDLLGVCAAVKPVQVICVWLLEPCHSEVIPSIPCTI